MTTPVAAAASVPFSSTSTNALCTTAEITRSREPVMPEKSALPATNAAGHAKGGERAFQLALGCELESWQADLARCR